MSGNSLSARKNCSASIIAWELHIKSKRPPPCSRAWLWQEITRVPPVLDGKINLYHLVVTVPPNLSVVRVRADPMASPYGPKNFSVCVEVAPGDYKTRSRHWVGAIATRQVVAEVLICRRFSPRGNVATRGLCGAIRNRGHLRPRQCGLALVRAIVSVLFGRKKTLIHAFLCPCHDFRRAEFDVAVASLLSPEPVC